MTASSKKLYLHYTHVYTVSPNASFLYLKSSSFTMQLHVAPGVCYQGVAMVFTAAAKVSRPLQNVMIFRKM